MSKFVAPQAAKAFTALWVPVLVQIVTQLLASNLPLSDTVHTVVEIVGIVLTGIAGNQGVYWTKNAPHPGPIGSTT